MILYVFHLLQDTGISWELLGPHGVSWGLPGVSVGPRGHFGSRPWRGMPRFPVRLLGCRAPIAVLSGGTLEPLAELGGCMLFRGRPTCVLAMRTS